VIDESLEAYEVMTLPLVATAKSSEENVITKSIKITFLIRSMLEEDMK
jgi:hypothetical protein